MENAKRICCQRCLRAARACICSCIRQVDSEITVLILQHPAEVNHIKGSARLLHLCLPRSTMMVGERFDEAALQQMLTMDHKVNVLLYPDSAVIGLPEMSTVPDSPNTPKISTVHPSALRLILLDASWRHSKQMLMHNPILRSFPRFAVQAVPSSRYQIRRAYAEDQLSTLEAATYALMQLESKADKFTPLLQAFDAFNAMQIGFGVNKLLRAKNRS